MMYRIEYQDLATSGYCWNCGEESYPNSHEAQRAIHDLLALGGVWSRCAYRVRPIQKTAPTHAELVRFVERLGNEGVEFAFWSGEDGSEAVLFAEDEIATAVPGGPLRRGWVVDRPIKAVVRELVAGDHEAVARARAATLETQEREAVARARAATLETQERAAVQERERAAAAARQRADAQERERAAAAAVETQQRAAAQERERLAQQERERAEAQERERVAKQERERAEAQQRARAAAEERERVAAVEAQQRAAAAERERAAAIEAQRRAAALERERAAAVEAQQRAAAAERERAVAIEAQQRAAAALAREHAAAVERERAAVEARQRAAAAQDRERAAAVEAQRRAAAQERERVASLQPSVEATRTRSTAPVAIPQSIAAAVHRPPLARVAEPQPVVRVAQGSPVARIAPSAFVPEIPKSPALGSEGELVALAKLLRCGAWREGMRASDLLTAEQLPAGARRAIQELVGTATPNVRALGNALKRVQNKRIDGIALRLTRKTDNHGFAIWQVVNDPAATGTTSEGPGKEELLRGAITGMGFRLADANHAISTLRDCIETDSLAELVRKALAVLRQRPSAASESKRK